MSAAICAWSRSVMIMAGLTAGEASRTQATKKDIVAVVALDASIQATGTPVALKSCDSKNNCIITHHVPISP